MTRRTTHALRTEIPRVLVAEDDPAFRRLVVSKLLDDGCEVYEASGGFELLALLSAPTWRPIGSLDLLVLDHRMPGCTGIQAIRYLRARHFAAPCILMSAFPEASLWTEAESLGATLIAKPFALGVLSDVAAIAIRRSHAC